MQRKDGELHPRGGDLHIRNVESHKRDFAIHLHGGEIHKHGGNFHWYGKVLLLYGNEFHLCGNGFHLPGGELHLRGVELHLARLDFSWTMRGWMGWDGGMKGTEKDAKGILAKLLASESRWRLLEELSKGGVFSVTELAKVAGLSQPAASLHMIRLREAGIVVQGKGRLYTLAPGVLAEGGGRELRMGICTLRFGGGAGVE